MARKKMRKIYHWRKECRRKRAGRLKPAAPLAFRARRNRRENSRTIVDAAVATVASEAPRRGGQWHGRIKIAPDFDETPDAFARIVEP